MKTVKSNLFMAILFASTLLFATEVDTSINTDDKRNEQLLNSVGATDIVDLSAKSSTGLYVCHFRLKSLPDTNTGVLYMADGTVAEINKNLTWTEAGGLKFDPKEGYVGEASFTYVGVDVNGNEGTVGTVTLPIIADNSKSDDNTDNNGTENNNTVGGGNGETLTVVTDDKINPKMLNTLPAVDILDLSGKDANGVAVNNFIIKSLPTEEAGTLYMADGNTTVSVEQNLTKDESDGLKFDPKEGYIGDATFTYQSVDANGELGNIATVTLPVVNSLADNNGSCVCNDYEESIPSVNNFGLFSIILLTSLLGVLFVRKEIV